MAFLTDEEYNALYDVVAANEGLTAEQMDALTAMREDMYERMNYMKDNDSYREKFEALEQKYRERWREETQPPVHEDEEEEKEEISYESLYED